MLASIEPEGSFARFRARCLWAETYYEMGRPWQDRHYYNDALAIYEPMLTNPPIKLTEPLRGELHWMVGAIYYGLQRHAEAVPHLQAAAETRGQYFTSNARRYHIQAIAIIGRRNEALELFSLHEPSLTPEMRDTINVELNSTIQTSLLPELQISNPVQEE